MAPGSSLTRRGFGGLLGAAAGTGALSPTWASANADQETEHQPSDRGRPSRKPNLLVILGDDLGWADLSSYGAPHIRTPNLDRLARQGVRFTDGYSGSADLLAHPLQPLHRPLPGPYARAGWPSPSRTSSLGPTRPIRRWPPCWRRPATPPR